MRTAKGVVYQNVENVIHALSEAPDMGGLLTYDTLMRRAMRLDKLPGSEREAGPVEDVDYIEVQCWLQRRAGMPTVGRETVINAMDTVAYRHAYHPIREYLDTLVWDGQARLDEMLIKYAGAAPGEYARAVARMTLLAMVARIFEPGCQVDYVLVLEGEQGIGKSNFIRALGGRWFDDSMPSLHGNDDTRGSMHMRGKWVIEISELHAFSKADIEKLKAMITRREENYVAKYGRTETSEARQCIFIGTTNRKTYFNDETGNRRFWPIVVTVFDIIGILEARDQLFAEAVHRYKAGEHWWPTRELEVEHFIDEQDSRFEVDVWEDHILPFLSDKATITLSQISAEVLKVYEDRQNGQSTRRIVAILERAGWQRRNVRGHGGVRHWIPPGVSNPPGIKKFRRES
jgi:predicted P-loop ATPase